MCASLANSSSRSFRRVQPVRASARALPVFPPAATSLHPTFLIISRVIAMTKTMNNILMTVMHSSYGRARNNWTLQCKNNFN